MPIPIPITMPIPIPIPIPVPIKFSVSAEASGNNWRTKGNFLPGNSWLNTKLRSLTDVVEVTRAVVLLYLFYLY